MNLSPRARALMALQQERYLQSLPEKKERITRCWRAIQNEGWTPDSSAALKTQVHRLSGSAGSYGLDAMGQAAQALDRLLGGETDGGPATRVVESSCGRLIDALLHEMEQVITGASVAGQRAGGSARG
jgi:HPt (histidine-containing phosphotransfer) domain-containing protein